jgi:hypothetical protein
MLTVACGVFLGILLFFIFIGVIQMRAETRREEADTARWMAALDREDAAERARAESPSGRLESAIIEAECAAIAAGHNWLTIWDANAVDHMGRPIRSYQLKDAA